jgi:uncharacterized membrane protein YgaE (UPF0421/DUF939 family)
LLWYSDGNSLSHAYYRSLFSAVEMLVSLVIGKFAAVAAADLCSSSSCIVGVYNAVSSGGSSD